MSERADEPQDAVPDRPGQNWPPADSMNDAPTQVAGYQPPRAPQAEQQPYPAAPQPVQGQQPVQQPYGYPQQAGQPYQQQPQPYQQFGAQQGYGYPQQPTAPQNPYQQQPQANPYAQQPAAYVPPQSTGPAEPDWGQLAERHESREKKRRQLTLIGAVVGVLAVGGGVAAMVLTGGGGKPDAQTSSSPAVSKSASPSPKPSPTATAVAADRGGVPLALGPGAKLDTAAGTLVLPGGGDSYAAGNSPVAVTSQSFTVSLRVNASSSTGVMAAVSQGSATDYSFAVGRVMQNGQLYWMARVRQAKGSVIVVSRNPGQINQWTVLTMVYEARTKTLTLYVNGVAQGSHRTTGIANASGGLQLGRIRFAGGWAANWAGQIADVRVWQKALGPDEIGSVAVGSALTQNPAPYAWLTKH